MKLGATDITDIKLGTVDIAKVMFGADEVWSAGPDVTFSRDFSALSAGSGIATPSGFTAFDEGGSHVLNVVTDSAAVGGKWLEMVPSGSQVHYLTFDTPGTAADMEVVAQIMTGDLSSGAVQGPHVFLRAAQNDTVFLAARVDDLGAGLRTFYGITGDNFEQLTNGSTPTFGSDEVWWVRMQVIGTALKVRAWQPADPSDPGADEPGTWDVEDTLSPPAPSSAGYAAFGSRQSGTVRLGYLGVSIAPSTSPAPFPTFEGGGDPGGGGGLLGLSVTDTLLAEWQSRATVGPFKSDGDYATNSPGDWDDIVANKTSFAASPSTYRWSGPPGTGAIPLDNTASPNWNNHWGKLQAAAFYSLVENDATLRAQVATEMLAQSQVSRLNFYNTTDYADRNGAESGPVFEISNFITAYALAMDWLEVGDPDIFTSQERDDLHTWFFGWAQWVMRELDTAFKKLGSFDSQSAPPWSLTYSSGGEEYRLAYDALGSNTIGAPARYFNNRRLCAARCVGIVGQKLVNAEFTAPGGHYGWTPAQMVTAAKNIAKGWLVYSAYPEGYIGEFERITSNGGMYYPWQAVAPVLSLAHVLALNGDDDLWTYTTRDGYEGTECTGGDPDKTLEWVVTELLKHTEQNTYTRHKNTVLIGMQNQENNSHYGHDSTAAIGFQHYSNLSYIKPATERTYGNMSGWQAIMAGFGDRPWSAGDWGVWPAVMFMFNLP